MVIWLIGLSGSGKTTIGEILTAHLREKLDNVVFLDGDVLREIWANDVDHSVAGRLINAERISKLSHLLEAQNINVVASVLSIFPEWQSWNRANLLDYMEIYLKADMETLEARDPKGIYRQARDGKLVVGYDITFPEPKSPNFIYDTTGKDGSASEIADKIINQLPLLATGSS